MLALAAVLGVALPSLLAPAGTAHAASYRFWGYYQLTGSSWAFAQKGPAETTPKDGAVEGWRFAVSDETTPALPRATPTFAALCGGTAAKAGSKRVGVVIDSGRPADAEGGATPPAPQAACAVVDTKASGAEVLATVASVRVDKGLTCAINGYPATGCGAEVKQVPAAAKAADTPVTIPAGATAAPSASPRRGPAGEPRDQRRRPGRSGVSAATWAGIIIVLALVAVVAPRRAAPPRGPEPPRAAARAPPRRPPRPAPAAAPGGVVAVGARPGDGGVAAPTNPFLLAAGPRRRRRGS